MLKIFLTGSTGYVGTKFIDLFGSSYQIMGVAMHDNTHPVDLLDTARVAAIYHECKPDVLIHLAGIRSHHTTNDNQHMETSIIQNLINLALPTRTPFIFTSSEAVYGGKWDKGDYKETDSYEPRNLHGAAKVACEKLLIDSGLPYLITRGHRHVGVSPRFHKQKWFPDTLNDLAAGKEVHLDSKKIFNPILINNLCDIFDHHLRHNLNRQTIINVGVDKKTTYYDFVSDVAKILNFDTSHVHNDGDEAGWPINSSINVDKMRELGYPSPAYDDILATIAADFKNRPQ